MKDYFTGIVLLIENQIRAGDFIEVGGKSGTVENVTLRYVRLRDAHGNVHFVPNGQIDYISSDNTTDAEYFDRLQVFKTAKEYSGGVLLNNLPTEH